ncbi:hypothetical protein [Nostoc sp.]
MIFGDACGGLRLRIVIEVRRFESGDRTTATERRECDRFFLMNSCKI